MLLLRGEDHLLEKIEVVKKIKIIDQARFNGCEIGMRLKPKVGT